MTSTSATLPFVSPSLGLPVGPNPQTTPRSVSPSSGLLGRIQSRGEEAVQAQTVTVDRAGSGGLAGIGKKSWSRSMDDLSKLLTGGEKSSTTAANKARIDEYRRKKDGEEAGEEQLVR